MAGKYDVLGGLQPFQASANALQTNQGASMKEFFLTFIPIFVAVDPVGLVPILVSLTQNCDAAVKRKILIESTITALVLSLGFMLAGQAVFRFLGVSVGDFMIAGGVILFCIALMDLLSASFKQRPLPVGDLGAVPIGTPLIAGPALLTTSLMLMNQHGFWLTAVCVVVNILLTGILFVLFEKLLTFIQLSAVRAFSKIVSLLLAAIAVMMIRRGMETFF